MNTLLAPSRSGPQVTKLFWPLNPTEKKKHTCWWWLDKCTQSLWVINLADCNKTDSQDTLQNTASGSSETLLGETNRNQNKDVKIWVLYRNRERSFFNLLWAWDKEKTLFLFLLATNHHSITFKDQMLLSLPLPHLCQT